MQLNRFAGWLLGLLVIHWPVTVAAIEESEILDYGEAFVISARALDTESLEVSWKIKPNHYMYTRFLSVETTTPGARLGEMDVSPGVRKFDELLGEEVETFHEQMMLTVPYTLADDSLRDITLKVRSQGCIENILCYPPTVQQVSVRLPGQPLAETSAGQDNPLEYTSPAGLGQDEALPPEEAFSYEAIALNAGTLLVRFIPRTGYYLYRDKFVFRITEPEEFAVRNAGLPAGKIKNDPEFGPVEVYFEMVEIPLRINRPAGPEQSIILAAGFQGCRDGEICYPPMQRNVAVVIPAATAAIDELAPTAAGQSKHSAPVTEQDRLASLLLSNPGRAMLAFFGLGILLAFTPCVFPMIPILSGIIAGQGNSITTRKALVLSAVYVLAMALTYTVAGVIAGLFGKNLQAFFQDPWIIGGFVLLFVLLSLSMFGFYELQLPARLQGKLTEITGRQEGGDLLGVAIMGFLSALIVGPCVAPPLAAALIVIGRSGDAVLGGGALFSMSIGMGVPLLAVGTSAGRWLPRAGAWMNVVKAVFGIGLLALAIWMLGRIVPDPVVMCLWGLLALACGIYLVVLERMPDSRPGWRSAWKSLGVVLILLGMLEFVGAWSGGDDWLRPLQHLRSGASSSEAHELGFRRIKSVEDLDFELQEAAEADQRVMLDFYADWCVECKRMEKTTFRDARVRQALEGVRLLQADVTRFDAVDEALVKRFALYGPPAIIFFDREGKEKPRVRMIGYMNAETFLQHLSLALE